MKPRIVNKWIRGAHLCYYFIIESIQYCKNLTGLTVTPLAFIRGARFRFSDKEQVLTLLDNTPLGKFKQTGRG
jgi:hypothetical protein